MASLNAWTLVDDLDSRIVYSPGWQVVTGGSEASDRCFDRPNPIFYAKRQFLAPGTLVSAIGSLGSVDVYGIPSTSYAIDGTPLLNYTAPVIPPGGFRLNVTFFTSPTLSPGNHQLTITNLNGTKPNVFWLDYILYAPSVLPSASVTPSQVPSSTSTSRSAGATAPPSGSSAQARGPNVGAIVGGVIGGVAFIAILAILAWWFLIRRRVPTSDSQGAVDEIRPFTSSSRGPITRDSALLSPTSTSKSAMLLHHAASGGETLASSILQGRGDGDQPSSRTKGSSAGAGEPLMQQVDSGLRLVDGEASLPPPYSHE
ncbi:hypothetical protein C8T65DRAFT_740797 [Cerioporus squamosus]|nr:hypothetical protein C8T65DRAFT_740797 [Cerioporus squamosus]